MLPQFFKFIVVNNSGQTLTFNSNGRLNMKMTGLRISQVTGKVSYVQLDDDDLGFVAAGTLADAAEILSSLIDNTDHQFVGLQVQLEVTHDEGSAADGTFDVYLAGDNARHGRRAAGLIQDLFAAYLADPTLLPDRYRKRTETDGLHRVICDFLAGMTDRFCRREHERICGK